MVANGGGIVLGNSLSCGELDEKIDTTVSEKLKK